MAFDLGSILTGGVFSGIADIVKLFKADPNMVAQHSEKLAELELQVRSAQQQYELQMTQAQTKINEIEAASEDKFTSRWRPAVGWVCCFGLIYATIGDPLLSWVSINNHLQAPPSLNTDVLTSILFGLLGLAGMRSFEKTKGVAGNGNAPVSPK